MDAAFAARFAGKMTKPQSAERLKAVTGDWSQQADYQVRKLTNQLIIEQLEAEELARQPKRKALERPNRVVPNLKADLASATDERARLRE